MYVTLLFQTWMNVILRNTTAASLQIALTIMGATAVTVIAVLVEMASLV